MAFAESEGTRIYYDSRGKGEPVLLCLTGWCVHQTIFLPLAERLSAQHRVLAMDWRGHGKSQASNQDFGYAEMLADILSVIKASGAHSVIPIAQAHGGWAAIALRQQLGERVLKMVSISWNPILISGNPVAPSFLRARQALQDPAHWRERLEQMLTMWLKDAPAAVNTHIRNEMESIALRIGRERDARFRLCTHATAIRCRH
jgi:pimeloyl-ACP methyl ester carboxylesterase